MTDYDPAHDGVLLGNKDVCKLLHVSRTQLAELRRRRILIGYKIHPKGHWKYPSNQRTLVEARAALQAQR